MCSASPMIGAPRSAEVLLLAATKGILRVSRYHGGDNYDDDELDEMTMFI